MCRILNRNPNRAQAAFTLIEMLIVLAMFSLIGLAVVSTLSSGIKIWQRLTRAERQEDINIFFDRFAKELRNTFKFTAIKFRGEKDRIAFAAFVTTPGSSLAQESGIGEVDYSYGKSGRELSKQVRNYSQIYEGGSGSSRVLFTEVESVKFEYYFYDDKEKEYFWLEEWGLQDEPPLAVRVQLEFRNGQQSEKVTRTIDIPISQL
ncbi:MAG: type II secretion system protein GspJ [Candidatus Omnitrophota bacterium]